MRTSIAIFATPDYMAFGKKVARAAKTIYGKIKHVTFSCGEHWTKYMNNIRGKHVFLISSTDSSDNIMRLFIMIDAAKRASARSITAVIPYYGYARQDRKEQPRVPITAKLMAILLQAAGATRVICMDLHNPSIQGFFDIPFDHLEASKRLIPYARKNFKRPNTVVVSPDIGGIKRARAYAKRLHLDLVVIDKRRPKKGQAEVINIIGKVKGKHVLIVDDIIDSAGTLEKAIEALHRAGCKNVYYMCSHPVLSGEAYERIKRMKVSAVVVTDTLPLKAKSPKIRVVSVAQLFGEAIARAHSHRSISNLYFDKKNGEQ